VLAAVKKSPISGERCGGSGRRRSLRSAALQWLRDSNSHPSSSDSSRRQC
ncbi:Hypothetical predicted protein, partial [Olea europaea subsp. europaea]